MGNGYIDLYSLGAASEFASSACGAPAGRKYGIMNAAEPNLTGLTFDEIAAKYGEETAIQAGIAADPEWGPDELDMSDARPATELLPDLVEFVERAETQSAR